MSYIVTPIMELFTTELIKYKNLSEKLTKNCDLLQTEVNLLNKLLFFEQKFSDQLINVLFVLYDKYFSDNQQNYRYFDVQKQLEDHKSIAKQNQIQVKNLRQKLYSWRQINERLNDDHSFSSGTDSMTKIKDKSLPKLTKIQNTNETQVKCQSATTSVTQPSTTAEEVRPEVNNPSISVKLEVIPKTEPEECLVNEETDSASEADCLIEGVEPTPTSPPATHPFLFVSEFLSRNKSFSHLLDQQNKEQSTEEPTPIDGSDKRIAIDLNTDSENSLPETTAANTQPVVGGVPPTLNTSIFAEEVIDLTPIEKSVKKKTSKKSPKKSFIKKRIRFTKKRTTLRSTAKPIEPTDENPSISEEQSPKNRTIASSRKKININPDNTITITEIRGSPEKKKSKSEDSLVSNHTLIDPMSSASRTEKARTNEKIINSTKKIVLKGKFYYCRWKDCSYTTTQRGNAIRHLWKHTGETPFKCEHCPQGFRDKRHLTAHMITHNEDVVQQKVNTKVLPKDKVVPKVKVTEVSTRRKGMGSLVCPECKGKYMHFQHLVRHLRKSHGSEKADNYKEQYYKERRVLRKTSGTNKLKTSSLKSGSKRTAVEKSPKTRLDLSLKPISPKKFYKKTENSPKNISNQPIETSTQGTAANEAKADLQWKCDFKSCGRSYSGKQNLKRHQMEIHKKLSKPLFYGTLKGGKIYKFFIPKVTQNVTQNALNSPKKPKTVKIKTSVVPISEGTAVKAFACNFKGCTISYQSISGLYKHKMRVHNMTKTTYQKTKKLKNSTTAQQSTDDKQSIAAKTTLKKKGKNKFTTDKERTFVCPEEGCGSRFVWAKNMKTHMRDKHNILMATNELIPEDNSPIEEEVTEEKFQCPYSGCQFESGSAKVQVIHYRTHFSSEDKPFKCLIKDCDYSAAKLSLLKYHVLNRHSEQQFFKAMEETGVHYPSWY